MNKLKKVTIYLILFLTLVVGTNTIKITKVDADSGFDSSYDSGGSSWGGSSDSWDSSSRWDSSDSSSGSGKPASLTNLKIENNIETATVIMTVNCYDYIVDSQNKVVRGNNKNKIEITYELTYIKSVGEKVNKCPNCGAEINDDNSTTCEYCRAIITRNTSKWVLSKKQSLNQRQL